MQKMHIARGMLLNVKNKAIIAQVNEKFKYR